MSIHLFDLKRSAPVWTSMIILMCQILFADLAIAGPLTNVPSMDRRGVSPQTPVTNLSSPLIDPSRIRCYSGQGARERVTVPLCEDLFDFMKLDPPSMAIPYKGDNKFQIPDCPCIANLDGPEKQEVLMSDIVLVANIQAIILHCAVSHEKSTPPVCRGANG